MLGMPEGLGTASAAALLDDLRRDFLRAEQSASPLLSQVSAGSERGEETENGTGPSAASAAIAGAGSATDRSEARRIGSVVELLVLEGLKAVEGAAYLVDAHMPIE